MEKEGCDQRGSKSKKGKKRGEAGKRQVLSGRSGKPREEPAVSWRYVSRDIMRKLGEQARRQRRQEQDQQFFLNDFIWCREPYGTTFCMNSRIGHKVLPRQMRGCEVNTKRVLRSNTIIINSTTTTYPLTHVLRCSSFGYHDRV